MPGPRPRAEELPIPLEGAILYFVGPTPARPGRVIGSAGPTTSARMDPFSPRLIARGLRAMIGKGYRSDEVRQALRQYGAVHLATLGGAGALLSRHIVRAEVVAYEDLGTEAIRRLEVVDFPAVVAYDAAGGSVYDDVRRKRSLEYDMKTALLGLSQSGKSTIFSAISGKAIPPMGLNNIEEAIVPVPDERLVWLEKLYKPAEDGPGDDRRAGPAGLQLHGRARPDRGSTADRPDPDRGHAGHGDPGVRRPVGARRTATRSIPNAIWWNCRPNCCSPTWNW